MDVLLRVGRHALLDHLHEREAAMKLRDRTFLGTTTSLCPTCLEEGKTAKEALLTAKIVEKDGRIFFEKRCNIHGPRADFVCSDAEAYDDHAFSVAGKVPEVFGTDAKDGCPLDCGLCEEHEQHTCVGLVEVTSACNLECPMCYAESGPGGDHLPYETVTRMIDRLVEVEGGAEVLQISGGEPLVHPDFERILEYAIAQKIELVMVNTNGLKLAVNDSLVALLAKHRTRLEVYLQFDGFSDATYKTLRGAALVEQKLRAVERLGEAGVRVILVCTLQAGVNDQEIGAIVRWGAERPWVTGVSFQPATYSGRNVKPETLASRITYPDVVRMIAEQTDGMFEEKDFIPLPCAHPNCHTLTYAFRKDGMLTPLMRFIRANENVDILANGISFTRAKAKELVERYITESACKESGCDSIESYLAQLERRGEKTEHEFYSRALAHDLAPSDVFRITITSFLDAYNFDVRRLMKCCIHHVLPSGHVVPFCAYNVLYRPGHAKLPELARPPLLQLRTSRSSS
jgi:uncharacterized radical SAM superfamily Fe-S cluster-containing enzyme